MLSIVFLIGLYYLAKYLINAYSNIEEKHLYKKRDKYLENQKKLIGTPTEFMSVSEFSKQSRHIQDFRGCYIIHNQDSNRYYVGQSVHVVERLVEHMSGRGNPDVYRDMSNGASFSLAMVPLSWTNEVNLNSQERHLIAHYNSYYNGYNKTRGNHD